MAKFHLGLTMAGAISAGAYAAGVFDFLTQALDCWEAEKAARRQAGTPEDQWDIPSHAVEIPVLTGASAGAIVSAIGLVALADQPPDATTAAPINVDGVGTIAARLPRLYRAWVQMPCFVNQAGGADLLGTADLGDGPLCSLLDSSCLGDIATASLLGIKAVAPPRPYLSATLHLFVTHTSLRGVPYDIGFSVGGGEIEGYGMLLHGERRHFVMQGLGTGDFTSPWASLDLPTAIQIPTHTLAGLTSVSGVWSDYTEGALGSSAFPVGLTPRAVLDATLGVYQSRQWPLTELADPPPGMPPFSLRPHFPDSMSALPGTALPYVTVDGGAIDNEPFELARWSLMQTPGTPNPREIAETDRAVLMIDPFPDPPAYDLIGNMDLGLRSVLSRLLPAMINQARFKPAELAAALKEHEYSRYLISPRRRTARGAPLERYGIACGLLGGFGGFLAESFRAHDYQLGRLNCFLFLRDSLAMSLDNKILQAGYAAPARQPGFQSQAVITDAFGKIIPEYQLIPLLGAAAVAPTPPTWPRVAQAVADRMVERAGLRAQAVVAKTLTGRLGSVPRNALRVVWSAFGKSALTEAIRLRLLRDLVQRDQIDGATAGRPEGERSVIAALLNPAYDFRTSLGIAAECRLGEAEVSQVLHDARYAGVITGGPTAPKGQPSYTHITRKPGRVASLPGIRSIVGWATGQPLID